MRLYLTAARMVGLLLGFGPVAAFALGLGDISLDSALNQPFSAEIPLESVDAAELAELKVSLASTDTFERYGLDRPAFLGDFRFTVAENSNGVPVISLSSLQPVSEPFVTLLLDVRWSSGRLLREYTVLLDPPLFENTVVEPAVQPAKTVAAPVAAANTGNVERQSATTEYDSNQVVESTGLFQSAAPESGAAPEPAAESVPASQPSQSAYSAPVANSTLNAQGDYTTQKGDTLWGIAERTRGGTGLSNNQMMLALYRANPDAFMGNINVLKAGAILRVSAGIEQAAPSESEAIATVREQNAAWSGARSASAAPAEEARLQLVAPGTDTEVADGASQGASGSGVSAGTSADTAGLRDQIGALEKDLNESQRLLQVRDAEMLALQQRIAELEQSQGAAGDLALEDTDAAPEQPAEADPLADEVADEQIFADEPDAALDDEIVDEAVAVDEEVTADVGEEMPADSTTSVTTDSEGDSFIGSLLGNMWLWISAAVVLLLAIFLARRRKDGEEEAEAEADAAASWATEISEPSHDDTLKDFGVGDDAPESIFEEAEAEAEAEAEYEEEDDPAVIAPAITDAASEDDALEQEFGEIDADATQNVGDSFESESSEVDIDFGDEISFDDLESDEPRQEAVGHDEVELPLERTISTGAPLNLDQADPIAEAEFHMAYGLYDQAADLLGKALEGDPDNRAYRVKLIEVFFVWENKEGFLEQARALHDASGEGGDSDWSKVLILGKQLCPDDALFSGSDMETPIGDSMDLELSDADARAGETEIDFALGDNESQALDMELSDESAADDGGLDFDLGDAADDASDELTLNLGGSGSDVTMDSQAAVDTVALDSSVDIDFGADADTGEDGDLDTSITDSADESSSIVDVDFGDVDFGELSDSETVESPTIENPAFDADLSDEDELVDSASTMETPTIELDMGAETLESPTLDTLGSAAETSEMPALDSLADEDLSDDDMLAESDSLDVDLSGLADLPIDSGDLIDLDDSEAADEIASTSSDDSPAYDDDETAFASAEELGEIAGDTEQDFEPEDISSDTVQQPSAESAGDTAEQPLLDGAADLDVTFEDDVASTEATGMPEDATMTEVGTKLDLARAYIDMGDPDGAISILNEVLDEGGEAQKQEARQLLSELGD